MKSLKSLFALLTLVAVSFACAPAQQSQTVTESTQPETTITITDDAVFSGGNDPKPILNKPKI